MTDHIVLLLLGGYGTILFAQDIRLALFDPQAYREKMLAWYTEGSLMYQWVSSAFFSALSRGFHILFFFGSILLWLILLFKMI